MRQARALSDSPAMRALLEVAWYTAARGGDIRQMWASDIEWKSLKKGEPMKMMVTFRRGKTAKKESYVVGAPLPSQETQDYINQRKVDKSWAFPGVTGEQIKNALRAVDEKLEQRSIRRGYLQHLSGLGWTDLQLLEVSHHASVQMLRRYLGMGVMSSTTHQTAAAAEPLSADS